jgi:hypothetical protein
MPGAARSIGRARPIATAQHLIFVIILPHREHHNQEKEHRIGEICLG